MEVFPFVIASDSVAISSQGRFADYLSFQPLPLWLSFLLKEKKQKFKKEGMLPPTGHTPGLPPLSFGPMLVKVPLIYKPDCSEYLPAPNACVV